MSKHRTLSAIILLCFDIVACTPTRVSDQVNPIAPEHWQNQPQEASVSPDLTSWWQDFHDPLLNQLIVQALAANHDIKIAEARIKEVRALATVAESALYPSFDFYTSGGREKKIDRIIGVPGRRGIELITPTGDAVSGGLTARWEIDLFGGRQLDKEAVLAQALGAEEALRVVQTGLLAQIATNYFELRGVQQRMTIQQKIITVNREKLRAVRALHSAGLAYSADLSSQETLLPTSEAVLSVLTQSASVLTHRLSILSGRNPTTLESRLILPQSSTVSLPVVPTLLPADLLTQRPDLRMAHTEVTAAAAKLGSARADLFPKIQLSASAGFGAIAVGGFPGLAETVYTLGTGLTAPIFNAGRIEAYISAADSRLQQAAINYEKTFLLAMEDVENAYVAHQTASRQAKYFVSAKFSAKNAYEQKKQLFIKGAENYLAVLDVKTNELALEDESIKANTAVTIALVSLYRAFGGGWH